MNIDFLAEEIHHIEHAKAVWKHIKNKGIFFQRRRNVTVSNRPIVVFSYNDLKVVNNVGRKNIVFGEHGIGLTFFPLHPSYAGFIGGKENVKLLLCPNKTVYDVYFSKVYNENDDLIPQAKKVIVGVPKMDRWAKKKFKINKKNPIVAISFHWDGIAHNQTRSARQFYINDLHTLKKYFYIIGHGHPRAFQKEGLGKDYEKQGIEVVEDFNEVVERADVYVVDCGSTGFEFAFTGKPIVFMDCPYYNVNRKSRFQNFRFWEYADMCPNVNSVRELPEAIYNSFDKKYNERRKEAVKNIFTYLDGRCGKRAANAIEKLFKKTTKVAGKR